MSTSIHGGTLTVSAPVPPSSLSLEDPSKNTTDIAIVGAGPSGLFAACLLKKTDPSSDIKIFDVRDRPTSFFGSFPVVLNVRGQKALAELGSDFMDRVRELARPVDGTHILSGTKTLAAVKSYGLAIMRDQLVGLLLTVVDRMEIPIYWNHKMTGIDTKTKSAVFGLTNESPIRDDQLVTVPVGRALVGADGNYSRVRRECERTHRLLKVQEWDWGLRMRYVLAPDPTIPPCSFDGANHYVSVDPSCQGYVCQQPDGNWSFSLSVTEDSDPFMTSKDPSPENIASLKALCERMGGGVFANDLLTSDDIYASFFRHRVFGGSLVRCSTLAPSDWIALVGDAGHAVAPYTGEGVNSSLESTRVLAGVLSNKDQNCSDYDAVRRIDAHALNEYAMRNRTIVSGTPSQQCANTFGTVVLAIAKKLGLVKATMDDYRVGERSTEGDPVPYSELVAMDKRQRQFLEPLGYLCFYTLCFCGKLRRKS